MVQPVPGNDRVTRGHLPAGSAAARVVGEGPRGPGTGGEGLPRQPGDPPGAGTRPRTPGSLAEVVLSLQPAPPGQRRSGRLAAGPQEAANQPVLTGQRPGRGRRPRAGRRAAVRGGTHRGPHPRSGLVDPGLGGDGPADLLRSELQATAALVFAQPLPAGVEPGPDYSRSYAEWLGRPLGADSDTGT